MRVQRVFYIIIIFISINYDIIGSSGIKCKPHVMKLTASNTSSHGNIVSKVTIFVQIPSTLNMQSLNHGTNDSLFSLQVDNALGNEP